MYPACSTPLLIACHKNNPDIIQLLLESKAKKLKLRNYMGGSLRESRNRLDMMRALTCPSYIAITSEDPVMTAFELSNLCKVGRYFTNRDKTFFIVVLLSRRLQKFMRYYHIQNAANLLLPLLEKFSSFSRYFLITIFTLYSDNAF